MYVKKRRQSSFGLFQIEISAHLYKKLTYQTVDKIKKRHFVLTRRRHKMPL